MSELVTQDGRVPTQVVLRDVSLSVFARRHSESSIPLQLFEAAVEICKESRPAPTTLM